MGSQTDRLIDPGNHIIDRLRRDILLLQGCKPVLGKTKLDTGLGSIVNHFPGASFPLAAVHEFISMKPEEGAATSGFVSGVISSLARNKGVIIWISCGRTVFPPALHSFNIDPERVLFVDLKKEKELLWVMEEALKCEGLSAVVGEIPGINFTSSRRLQLAVEKSRVTGFVLRQNPKQITTTACFTRWHISPLPSFLPGAMPGVGFPRWKVQLLKVRNGQPGEWQLEWNAGQFKPISNTSEFEQLQRKIG